MAAHARGTSTAILLARETDPQFGLIVLRSKVVRAPTTQSRSGRPARAWRGGGAARSRSAWLGGEAHLAKVVVGDPLEQCGELLGSLALLGEDLVGDPYRLVIAGALGDLAQHPVGRDL
jgi:hypothetical protein